MGASMTRCGTIILGGEHVPVDAPTRLYTDHGMTFEGHAGTVRRTAKPDLVIWHWTGGEGGANSVYGTLINRGLGVSFCVDRAGVIWQYLDPVVWDPRDTGGAMGKRSISIEVVNYGFRLKGQPIPSAGRDRIVDHEKIHGMRFQVARFYDKQIHSLAALTKALCGALDIPLRFPREADGGVALRELTNAEKRRFRGVIGHFHKTDQKTDPGFDVFRQLGHLEDRG